MLERLEWAFRYRNGLHIGGVRFGGAANVRSNGYRNQTYIHPWLEIAPHTVPRRVEAIIKAKGWYRDKYNQSSK